MIRQNNYSVFILKKIFIDSTKYSVIFLPTQNLSSQEIIENLLLWLNIKKLFFFNIYLLYLNPKQVA